MKYITFILSLLGFLVASILLVPSFDSCAPNAAAAIQTEWIPLPGTEGWYVNAIETDGRRLYAATSEGVYISLNNGHTWRLTLDVNDCTAITIHQHTVYAGTYYDGVFRSDSYGDTWKSINNGFRVFDWREGETTYGNIKQILATGAGTLITAVRPHTYTSADRGETWHDVSDEWKVPQREAPDWIFGHDIDLIAEFDGYLWAATWSHILRSPDNGQTWEYASTGNEGFAWPTDWAVFNDRLYIAGEEHYFGRNRSEKGFFARYEGARHWEVLTEGLPPHDVETTEFYGVPMVLRTHLTNIESLAANRGRLFAGLRRRGVWLFDERSEMWIPAGLVGVDIRSLTSHQSDLFAGTNDGIYRASIPIVNPHGKAATTWGAVKTE